MEKSHMQALNDFIEHAEPFLARLDELPKETVIELYLLHKEAITCATENINRIDPEIRVILCDGQNSILNRIVDLNPTYENLNIQGIYTPAIQNFGRWVNVQLMKDCGMVGYTLANELKTHLTMMFATEPSEYPYHKLMPGLEVLYTNKNDAPLPNTVGDRSIYFNHLKEQHHKMDALIFYGIYPQAYGYLDKYRRYRPDGKVYCGLDMNSYWMSITDWENQAVASFSNQCDVIATSCRFIRDALNRNPKVPFPCYWFPHAFANMQGFMPVADPAIKKNVMLYVGKVGTDQKNNTELLTAFNVISKVLPDWELRLVGGIAPEFRPFIEKYFNSFPELKERVTFTDVIVDKAELYKEYARAKIFVLTSKLEGGAPNVYAEALFHGCMIVTSNIDGADDMTNYGELGIKYTLGNISELSIALIKTALRAHGEELSAHIAKALKYAHENYDYRHNAKKLAFMLYESHAVFK